MIFKLGNGYRVTTTDTANGGVEFVTTNGAREVISTVTKHGGEANETLHNLRVADCIRFARQFGGRVHGTV